jgi:aminopeptidase YwaD
LLAEMLREYSGDLGVELLPFNGEDHYSAAGQKLYLSRAETHLERVCLNVNLDGLGWVGSPTAFSFYECSEALAGKARKAFSGVPEFIEGPAWPQGDHMIFAISGVPAMAITTAEFAVLEADIAHTPKDRPELVDPQKLVLTALALEGLIPQLK